MTAQSVSKGTWVLALGLVLGFLGFIYYLSSIPLQPNHRVISTPSEPNRTSEKSAKELDQLDFYQLLKEQRVSVESNENRPSKPIPKADSLAGVQYILQAGSFSKKEDAERLRATLLLEGFNATTEAVHVKGRQYHRVYVGPFKIKHQLERAKRALAQLKLKPMVIKQG